jgi:hypothetical protein
MTKIPEMDDRVKLKEQIEDNIVKFNKYLKFIFLKKIK